jgi:hypothetical protein
MDNPQVITTTYHGWIARYMALSIYQDDPQVITTTYHGLIARYMALSSHCSEIVSKPILIIMKR